MANLETLELTINGNATGASEGIDQLVHSLSALSHAVGKSIRGLIRLNDELRTLKGYGAIKLPNPANLTGAKSAVSKTKAVTNTYDIAHNNGRGVDVSKLTFPNKVPDDVWQKQYDERHAEILAKSHSREWYAQRRKELGWSDYEAPKKEIHDKEWFAQRRKELGWDKPLKPHTESKQAVEATREQTSALKEAKTATQEVKNETQNLANTTNNATQQTKGLANETRNLGKETSSVNKLTKTFSNLASTVGRIFKTMLIRQAIRAIIKGAKEGLDNFYQYAKQAGTGYASSLDKVATKWNQLKNQMGATLGTALAAVLPILHAIATVALYAFNALSALFALLSGKDTYAQATEAATEYGDAASGAASATKEWTAAFDELNIMQKEASGGGGGGGALDYSNMFNEVALPQWMIEWKPIIEAILAGVLGATILPKIWEWIKKIFGLFSGDAAETVTDVLQKLLKLNDGESKFPKIPDIASELAQMGLYAAAAEAAATAVGALKDKVVELKAALDGVSLISTILQAIVAAITSAIAGNITVKVNRDEFDKFKEEFEEFMKDKKIYISFDNEAYMSFLRQSQYVDAWLNKKGGIVIGINIDAEQYKSFIRQVDYINSWLAKNSQKKIGIGIDSTAYASLIRQIDYINAWLKDGSKKIYVNIDANGYASVIRQIDYLNSWIGKDDSKYIYLKFVDNAEGWSHLSTWIATEDTKVINIKFKGDGVNNNNNNGGSIFDSDFFRKPIWEIFEDPDFWSIPVWDYIKKMFTPSQDIEPVNIDVNTIVDFTGFDKMTAEERKNFVTSIFMAYGSSQALAALKKAVPNISVMGIVQMIDWDKFSETEKLNFMAAMSKAFGARDAIQAFKNAGIDVGALVAAGMKSKDPEIRKTAQEWSKILDTEVKDPPVTVSVSKSDVQGKAKDTNNWFKDALTKTYEVGVEAKQSAVETVAGYVNKWFGGKFTKEYTVKAKGDESSATSAASGLNTAFVQQFKNKYTLGVEASDTALKEVDEAIKAVTGKKRKLKFSAEEEDLNSATNTAGIAFAKAMIQKMKSLRIKITGNNITITQDTKAMGGFVKTGELFIAREAGPEMVGAIGNHTAVANNDQIVEGIASGVAAAQSEQNALLRRQNEILLGILNKSGTVQIGASSALGRVVNQSLEMYGMMTGV